MTRPMNPPCDNWQTFTSLLRLESAIVLGSTEIDNFQPSTFLSSMWYLKEKEEEKCPADSGIQTCVLKNTSLTRCHYHRCPSLTLPQVFLAKMTLTATTLDPSLSIIKKAIDSNFHLFTDARENDLFGIGSDLQNSVELATGNDVEAGSSLAQNFQDPFNKVLLWRQRWYDQSKTLCIGSAGL